jgi:TolB protein
VEDVFDLERKIAKHALVLLIMLPGLAFQAGSEQSSVTYKNYAPVWSPDGASIAFYTDRDGNWEIYVMKADGAGLTRLTDHPGYDGEPSWSPDGQRLAFTSDRDSDREIHIMNVDGSGITQITHNDRRDEDAAWSPSGDRIIFLSEHAEQRYVHEMKPDGSQQKRLSEISSEGRIRWSGDGSVITYVTDVGGQIGIHKMTPGGKSLAVLFTEHSYVGNPQASPDGKKILFDAHAEGITSSGDGKWELWTMNWDGTGVTRLTNDSKDDWGGDWSRDGRRIVYCGGGLNNTGYEIFTMNADGSARRQLTDR